MDGSTTSELTLNCGPGPDRTVRPSVTNAARFDQRLSSPHHRCQDSGRGEPLLADV